MVKLVHAKGAAYSSFMAGFCVAMVAETVARGGGAGFAVFMTTIAAVCVFGAIVCLDEDSDDEQTTQHEQGGEQP